MLKSNYIATLTSLLLVAGSAQMALAQSNIELLPADIAAPVQISPEEISPQQNVRPRRIKREVEPVTYWVDSEKLRLRDNPVAGTVVGKLDYGHKVLAYDQYENWVQVSAPGAKAQWVNSDFLSNSRLSRASYSRSGSTRLSDVIAVRIKDPEDRKNRTFGVRLKTADTGNALITTRQETKGGVFYQNRFVSCNKQRAVGSRIVGEGTTFLGAQNNDRGLGLDIHSAEQIDDKISGSLDGAISSFACKALSF